MPCASTHRLINFAATAGFLASQQRTSAARTLPHPIVGGGISVLLANLPDLVEPAIHPHHRQFFHSFMFASLLSYGVYKAYLWRPETPFEEFLRLAAIFSGSAYLLHLAADFTTARSLPLLGK